MEILLKRWLDNNDTAESRRTTTRTHNFDVFKRLEKQACYVVSRIYLRKNGKKACSKCLNEAPCQVQTRIESSKAKKNQERRKKLNCNIETIKEGSQLKLQLLHCFKGYEKKFNDCTMPRLQIMQQFAGSLPPGGRQS